MLTEETTLKSVEIYFSKKERFANVLWLNEILRDDEVISSVPHRRSYSKDEKDQFIKEVENGWDYISLLQW